eukprot:1135323-Amphidinium_carterae.1
MRLTPSIRPLFWLMVHRITQTVRPSVFRVYRGHRTSICSCLLLLSVLDHLSMAAQSIEAPTTPAFGAALTNSSAGSDLEVCSDLENLVLADDVVTLKGSSLATSSSSSREGSESWRHRTMVHVRQPLSVSDVARFLCGRQLSLRPLRESQ